MCQICGKESLKPWRVVDGKKLLHCETCNFYSFDKAEYSQEWSDQYLKDETSPTSYYSQSGPEDIFNFHRRLTLIENMVPSKGSILDVGCSVGYFLEAAKERGWKAEGIEPNPKAAKLAREKGFTIHETFLSRSFCSKIKKKFDVVHLGDVIEHVFDPVELVEAARDLLQQDGYLIMVTPDIESSLARMFQIKPREHVIYFSQRSLQLLVESRGFEVMINRRWSRFRAIGQMEHSTTFSAKGKVCLRWIRILGLSKLVAAFLYYFTRDEILLLAKKRT